MTKTELVEALAAKCDITKAAAGRALDSLVEVIEETLKTGDKIVIPGFGSFGISERAARTGRNPKTGEPLQIAAARLPKFSAGAKLKAAVAE